MPAASLIACPYCESLVRLVSEGDGRLVVHHLDLYGEQCEAGLRRMLAETAFGEGLTAVFPRDN